LRQFRGPTKFARVPVLARTIVAAVASNFIPRKWYIRQRPAVSGHFRSRAGGDKKNTKPKNRAGLPGAGKLQLDLQLVNDDSHQAMRCTIAISDGSPCNRLRHHDPTMVAMACGRFKVVLVRTPRSIGANGSGRVKRNMMMPSHVRNLGPYRTIKAVSRRAADASATLKWVLLTWGLGTRVRRLG